MNAKGQGADFQSRMAENDETELPAAFREQAFNIIQGALGVDIDAHMSSRGRRRVEHQVLREVLLKVRHELGLESLVDCHGFLKKAPPSHVLLLISEVFGYIDGCYRNPRFKNRFTQCMDPDAAVTDLNKRFAQHSLPFRWTGGRLQRTDSEFLNTEVIEPAIHLLRKMGFLGAEAEFSAANLAYLGDNHNEAIESATKAIESTLKAIFDSRSWTYGPKDGASKLIGLAMNNGLVPEYLREHFTGISKVLIAAPAIRNGERGVGHGQGAAVAKVPQHITAYALHSAGAAIVFLVECNRAFAEHGNPGA